ncbi:hypothetical protein [Nocardia sp. NPDC052566]|uniref:hypothetical protein n=1 Tax=Nocardia sp. NPDC052566 TaxID=3364330 RepID=UPI0037C9C8DC
MSIRDFNATGWMAYFTGSETLMSRQRDVDGWDPATGTALIVDAEQGVRRLVTDYPDFSHLEPTGRVVAALPGAGWRVRTLPWGEDAAPVEEVLAWLVTSDGRMTAIAVEEDGAFGPVGEPQWCFPPEQGVK